MLPTLILASLALSLSNLTPALFWLQEINSNLGPAYLLLHAISVIWVVRSYKSFRWSYFAFLLVALLGMICFYARIIVHAWTTPEVPYVTGRFVSVMLARSGTDAAQTQIVMRDVQAIKPELLLLTGVKSSDLKSAELTSDYPFIKSVIEEEGHGLAVFSRYQFASEPITSLGDFLPPALFADISLPGNQVKVGLISTLPPINQQAFRSDKLIIRRLVTMMRHQKDPVIVAGNFFSSPFSRFYGRIMEWTDLRSAADGHGMPGTWNVGGFGLSLPFDHMFSAYRIAPVSFQVLNEPKLVSRPIVVKYQLAAE